MPKIPIVQRPNSMGHQDNAVHLSGAPSLGWNTNNGMRELGDAMNRGTAGIAHGVAGVSETAMEFKRQSAEAENTLLAVKTQNLFWEKQRELDEKMAANPGAYEDFGTWAQEIDRSFDNESRKYLKKMTPEFQTSFSERLAGERNKVVSERVRIQNAAMSHTQRKIFDMLFDEAAEKGEWLVANEMLERERGRLIGKQEEAIYLNRFEKIYAGKQARDMIDSGTIDAAERLSAKNEDGSYKEFTHLSQEYRDQLVRYAEQTQARKEVEQYDQFYLDLCAGKPYSEEAILERNDLSVQTKKDFVSTLRSFQASTRQAQDQAAVKQKQYMRDALELEIMDFEFSSDPVERETQINAFNKRIYHDFAESNPAYAKQIKSQLNECVKAVIKPDSSYKTSYVYIQGKRMLDDMKKDFYSRYPGRGERWYSFVTNVYNDSGDLKKDNFAMAKVAFDSFMKANPTATQQDVETFLAKLKKDVNGAECDKIMEFWQGYSIPNTSQNFNTDELERDVGGRIAIFGKDKEFIRWKDGK